MRKFMALFSRELSAVFLTSVGYVTVALFMSATGWTFLHAVRTQAGSGIQVEALWVVSVLFWLPVLITVICMRLFAEEKRSGTIETLLTTAVADRTVVLAKFWGSMVFVVTGLLAAVVSLFALAYVAPGVEAVDLQALCGGVLILLLVAMCCTSIGVLVSLLTRNQIVAAIGCFWAICMPLMVRPLLQTIPFVRQDVLDRLSVERHVLQYTGGILHMSPAVLYVSITALMLFTAVRVLESRRWM
jgi:ABC-2 type transport system permease protein